MTEDKEILLNSVKAAENHLARSREGRQLLANGRSLAEMTTPLTGLSGEQTRKRREDYAAWLHDLSEDQLRLVFGNTRHLLEHRYQDPDKGTSELELRRILHEDEFKRRGLYIPEFEPRLPAA